MTDFLPMRCDACQGIFCKDHYQYTNHACEKAYLVDNQVPVCPLCNTPIPIKRGDLPDIRVSEHIDNDCQDVRAKSKRSAASGSRIFTNKCNAKGCKQKEMIPVLCSECKINFCLKHRHPVDHACDPRSARIPKSMQSLTSSASASVSSIRSSAAAAASSASRKIGQLFKPQTTTATTAHMDEDEALARAIQASLIETSQASTGSAAAESAPTSLLQEEEDRQLAQAIAESQRLAQTTSSSRTSNERCSLT